MSQEIIFGWGVYKELENILKRFSPKNIYLVSDRYAFRLSGAEKSISPILSKYNVVLFNDFEMNPKLYDVLRGVKLFNKFACDFIIGIGGGSVIDMAKSISILIEQNGKLKDIIRNGLILRSRKIPSVMMPTTAGSGSESTHFSVVYIDKTKYSLEHPTILSDYAILDPMFTETLSRYITACTGMDALCQAIESFWSVKSTDESRRYSKEAIELVLPNIVKAVNQPDRACRERMLKGSNFAGRAINIAKTTAPHSVSYPMTSYFNIPHGHAVALTLPGFLEFNFNLNENNCQDKRGGDFVLQRMNELLRVLEVETPIEARKKIICIMNEINMKTNLSYFNVNNHGIEIVIKNGFNLQRMKNNPRVVSELDLRKLLEDFRIDIVNT